MLISICSFFYNVFVVNDIPFESRFMLGWVVNFGLPFIPVFIPLWAYLRFRFSKITIKTFEGKSEKEISIEGNNQNEIIKFKESQFVMAQAQANYVDIHFLSENQLHKEMIRYTISGILDVIPSVQQIHRSYLVNPAMITDLNGNTRKGTVKLKYIEEEIPISPKHFKGVKKYLQNRP
ncbi:MAG: LytTR family DNA-binding domain-containing protein [Fulvivirga sp.]|nr:LytTR family DNA-binding domain-containing protein [Fulvivirga sp.]